MTVDSSDVLLDGEAVCTHCAYFVIMA
jgi:hypothetical protein